MNLLIFLIRYDYVWTILVWYTSHEVPRHGGSMSVSVDAPLAWLQGIGVMLCHVPFSVIWYVHTLLYVCYGQVSVCGGVWMHPRSVSVICYMIICFWWMRLCVQYTSFTTLVGLPYIYYMVGHPYLCRFVFVVWLWLKALFEGNHTKVCVWSGLVVDD